MPNHALAFIFRACRCSISSPNWAANAAMLTSSHSSCLSKWALTGWLLKRNISGRSRPNISLFYDVSACSQSRCAPGASAYGNTAPARQRLQWAQCGASPPCSKALASKSEPSKLTPLPRKPGVGHGNPKTVVRSRSSPRPGGMRACPAGNGKGACACYYGSGFQHPASAVAPRGHRSDEGCRTGYQCGCLQP